MHMCKHQWSSCRAHRWASASVAWEAVWLARVFDHGAWLKRQAADCTGELGFAWGPTYWHLLYRRHRLSRAAHRSAIGVTSSQLLSASRSLPWGLGGGLSGSVHCLRRARVASAQRPALVTPSVARRTASPCRPRASGSRSCPEAPAPRSGERTCLHQGSPRRTRSGVQAGRRVGRSPRVVKSADLGSGRLMTLGLCSMAVLELASGCEGNAVGHAGRLLQKGTSGYVHERGERTVAPSIRAIRRSALVYRPCTPRHTR